MPFRWIDNDAVEDLLKDIRRANEDDFVLADAEAPLLQDYKPTVGYAYALTGVVSGHPRLADGKEIVTSQLFYLDPDRGIARTMNRWYRLGPRAGKGQ